MKKKIVDSINLVATRIPWFYTEGEVRTFDRALNDTYLKDSSLESREYQHKYVILCIHKPCWNPERAPPVQLHLSLPLGFILYRHNAVAVDYLLVHLQCHLRTAFSGRPVSHLYLLTVAI
ncbi:hypothetical protein BDR07DRAFT_124350 [Suillus spraguei]|nr:hypothetical protein BDR07DRAFT_124350 [Suillus spraguei]